MSNGRIAKVVYVAFVVFFIGVAIWLATLDLGGALERFVEDWGYVGYFASASIAGMNVFVPTTHLIFTAPLLNAGLDPLLLVACGALGASLADLVGYAIGDRGRHAFSGATDRMARWLTDTVERRRRFAPVVLFLWAGFMPLPNEILVIPAGVMGYGMARTFLITLAGNVCFNALAIQLGLFVL